MRRGRPIKSPIRDNLVELLFWLKKDYGYRLAKLYNEIFAPVTQKSIYYHLNKGAQLGIFEICEIRIEKGDFSWGREAEKTYYALGSNACPKKRKVVEKKIKRLLGAFPVFP